MYEINDLINDYFLTRDEKNQVRIMIHKIQSNYIEKINLLSSKTIAKLLGALSNRPKHIILLIMLIIQLLLIQLMLNGKSSLNTWNIKSTALASFATPMNSIETKPKNPWSLLPQPATYYEKAMAKNQSHHS